MDNYYLKYIKYKSKYLELKGVKSSASINNVRGGSNDGAYYTKYMKYKNKYIKEKGLVGGVLGTKECPTTLGFIYKRSVWWYIRNYNCTYNDLLIKIPDKVNAISYADFIRTNSEPEHAEQKITIADLKLRGFPAGFLKNGGFPLAELKKDEGFDASALKAAGFDLLALKAAGFDASALKAVGFSASDFKDAAFTIIDLKKVGFSASELSGAGFLLYELIIGGYTASDFKGENFNATELKSFFSLQQLKDGGFSASELSGAGFDLLDLKGVGFDASALKGARFDASALKGVGFDASALKGAGFGLLALKGAGFDASALKDAGFTLYKFYKIGYTIKQLKELGFTLKDFKEAGFGKIPIVAISSKGIEIQPRLSTDNALKKFKELGFTARDFGDAKYSVDEMLDTGFTLKNMIESGIKRFWLVNYVTPEILSKYPDIEYTSEQIKERIKDCTTNEQIKKIIDDINYDRFVKIDLNILKDAGIKLQTLHSLIYKYTNKKLKDIGFSALDFNNANINILTAYAAGFTILELIYGNYNLKDLLKYYSVQWIENKSGVSLHELKQAAAAVSLRNLKRPELTQLEVKGLSALELKKAGFSALELKVAGFTANELKEAGYSNDDLTIAGYIFYIDKLGNMVQPSIYIADDNLLSDPKQLQTLLETSDKKIQLLHDYNEAYLLFYSKLKEYIYQKFGNNENMDNLKKNWKISLYGCNTDPNERKIFDKNRFTQEQPKKMLPKPMGIWGSELYPNNLTDNLTWIEWVLDNEDNNITGRPGNCTGFLIFRLKDNDKILHIETEDDLKKLEEYKKDMGFDIYDWKRLATKYHAINAPHTIKDWDVASTVVWDIDAVEEYHYLTLRDLPFVNRFINCEMLFLQQVQT